MITPPVPARLIPRACAVLALGLVALFPARAAILNVHPTPGQAAYSSVQSALNAAMPGDTVLLAPGVYRERVQFKRSGTPGNPIILEGQPGAIIDGSTPVTFSWTLAADIGPGVWRTPLPSDLASLIVSGKGFITVTADGRTLTTLSEEKTAPGAPQSGEVDIRFPAVFQDGVGVSGWDGVRALAMYRHAQQELIVRFKDNLDPRDMTITIAPKQPVVRINGYNRCVVRGVTLRNAAYGVLIAKSLGSVVERCVIECVDYGIWLDAPADRATLRFNKISLNPYAESNPRNRPASWDNWQAVKHGGFSDRAAIRINRTLGGHHIHDNHIHDHWDGIVDHGNPPWDPGVAPYTDNTGLRVHHNLIENLADDGIETAGPGIDGEWHHNLVRGTLCGFRLKHPRHGPLYIHHNIFLNNIEDFRHFASGANYHPDAEVWIYHNTSTSDAAVTMNYSGIENPSARNHRYYNNLFWAHHWVRNNNHIPDWESNNNVYVRITPEHPRPWLLAIPGYTHADNLSRDSARLAVWNEKRLLAQSLELDLKSTRYANHNPGFANPEQGDLSLRADSIVLQYTRRNLANETRRRLPGIHTGWPHAGALQSGEPMLVVPRDIQDVAVAPAGSWPPIDAIQTWRMTWFGNHGNYNNAANAASPAGDDIPNLLKFATSTADPRIPARQPGMLAQSGDTLFFLYPRNKEAANDVRYTVQWSDDLSPGSWTDVDGDPYFTMDDAEDGRIEHVLVSLPRGGSDRRFVRLTVSLLDGAESFLSVPQGVVALPVFGAGANGVLGVTLFGSPHYRGRASAVGVNTVTVGITSPLDAILEAGRSYALLIVGGQGAGLHTLVTGRTGQTLHLADDFSGLLLASDRFQLQPLPTIGELFGTGSRVLLAGDADQISVRDVFGSGTLTLFYSTGGTVGTGWRAVGRGSQNFAGQPVYFTDALGIQKNSAGNAAVNLFGAVRTDPVVLPVEPGMKPYATLFAAGSTLANSGLFSADTPANSLAGGLTSDSADLIYHLVGDGVGEVYYYSTGGSVGTGWRRVGGGVADQGQVELPSGILVFRRSGTVAVTLTPSY